MADKTRQIGGIYSKSDENGILYTIQLFVNNADIGTFTPAKCGKDIATGETGSAYNTRVGQTIMPVDPNPTGGTYIYSYEKKPVADHWILTIEACNADYIWEEGGSNEVMATAGGVKNRSFEQVFMLFPARWYGVVTLQEWQNGGTRTGTPKCYLPSASPQDATSSSDLVFNNATDGTRSASIANCLDLAWEESDCPFTKTDWKTWAASNLEYCNQMVPIIRYTVEFWIANTNLFTYYLQWKGINGDWSPPANISPDGYTTAGQWRSITQTVKEAVSPTNNITPKYYDDVTRVMDLAPTGLTWDSDRCGGTWTW